MTNISVLAPLELVILWWVPEVEAERSAPGALLPFSHCLQSLGSIGIPIENLQKGNFSSIFIDFLGGCRVSTNKPFLAVWAHGTC